MCPQLSSTSSWLGAGNLLCAAKSTQELIVLIIAVRSSPGIIGRLPFLGFATQDWYHLRVVNITNIEFQYIELIIIAI